MKQLESNSSHVVTSFYGGRFVRRALSGLVHGCAAAGLLAAVSPGLWAQDTGSPPPAATLVSSRSQELPKAPRQTHHFWDKQNDWLFAGVGASRALDYSSTLNFRRRGRDELLLTNDLVDNHAAFAAVEAGGTGLSIGVSYLFHHYGHHKLERWTSIVHISATTVGAVHNYSLKTAH